MVNARPVPFDGIEFVCGTVLIRLPKNTTPKQIADIAQRLTNPRDLSIAGDENCDRDKASGLQKGL